MFENFKKNLFNYSLVVNIIRSRRGPSGSSGDAAKIEFKESGDRKDAMKHLSEYKGGVDNKIANALSKMAEVKKRGGMIPVIEFKNQQKLNELQTASSKIFANYVEKIRTCSPDKINAFLKEALGKLKKIGEKAIEVVELEKDRSKMIEAIKKHAKEFKKKVKSKVLPNKHIEEKHLDMVLDAYLIRWQKVNVEALAKTSINNIKLLKQHFDSDNKRFKRGRFLEDLTSRKNSIRSEIDRVVNYWRAGDENLDRKIYKNSSWDTDYEKMIAKKAKEMAGSKSSWKEYLAAGGGVALGPVGAAYGYLASVAYDYLGDNTAKKIERAKKLLRQIYPPPLPDGIDEKDIISPLSTEQWVGTREHPGYQDELKTEIVKEKKLEEIIESANTLRDKLGKNLNKLTLGKNNVDKEKATVNFDLIDKSSNKKAGSVTLSQKNKMVVKLNTLGKPQTITIDETIDYKKFADEIEKQAYKSVLKEVKINTDSREVLVKGENLPGKPVQIDITKSNLRLTKPIRPGSADVSLLPDAQDIEVDFNKLIKQGLKDAMKDIPKDQVDVALKKIKDEEVKKLREKIFENARPKIVITGGASMEGSLSRNKELAKKRAESAKRSLLSQNPGIDKQYQIETRGYVYGPNFENITDLAQAEKNLVTLWNAEVATGKHKSEKVKNAKDIYAKLNNPKPHEKNFIESRFKNVRNATMTLEKSTSQQAPKAIAVKYEKTGSAKA